MEPAPFAFHPAQRARREAQLATLRNMAPTRPEHIPSTEPAYRPEKDRRPPHIALAPNKWAKIRNPSAHAYFIDLYPLMRPGFLKQLKAKGVSQWRIKMLRDMVHYYRSRAYDGIERSVRMEQKRKYLLGEILETVRSECKQA